MPIKKSRRTNRPNRRDFERYRRFAVAYLNLADPQTYLKSEGAAKKAGYSESFARGRSYQLLAKVGVQSEIKRIRDDRLKSSTIATPEEILESLTQMLRLLPNELVDENGVPIPLNKLSRDQAQAIAGFKFKRRTIPQGEEASIIEDTVEYKLTDRLISAEKLAKYHGLFNRDNLQKTPTVPQSMVSFPMATLTLAEWQEQALIILNAQERARKAGDQMPSLQGEAEKR
jgi:phage terminase small subunit